MISRFSSEAIADMLARQVVDASERMPKFIFPVLRAQLASGGPIDHIALVIAAWSRYLTGHDEAGRAITPIGRKSDVLAAAAFDANGAAATIAAATIAVLNARAGSR